MRPCWRGRRRMRLSPKVVTPSARRSPTNRSGLSKSSEAKATPSSTSALDDDGCRLDDGGGVGAGAQLELLGGLARHQRDDPVRPAGELDLGHDAVGLDPDDDARQPVARAAVRAVRAGAQEV